MARAGDHWAFKPLSQNPTPGQRLGKLSSSEAIDALIRAKQREHGLNFVSEAPRFRLLRRASFDLTGLPPSPRDLALFVEDRKPGAWARALDRLLASPHYGERWARWWLDLARYADTNGQDENKVMSNAWRYRDWVIRAFQNNLPIDQFIQLQLAGDLLPAEGLSDAGRHDRWIATGLLVLGPKMLAEQDKPKMALDIVDEQIDTVGRAFLGLTISCSRCHDHKDDPIPARDYYALAGIFKSTRTMEHFDFVSKFNERWLASEEAVSKWRKHRDKTDRLAKEIEAAVRKANEALGKPLPEKPREKYPRDTLLALMALEAEREALKHTAPPEPPRALAVQEGSITNLPVLIRGNPLTPDPLPVPRSFITCAQRSAPAPAVPVHASGRLELAAWLTSSDHPLTARVFVNRVWQAFLGEGLVRSSDNFGLRGEPPTHPELLDWMAAEFIRSGWDLKKLHRAILLSRAYQQDSVTVASNSGRRELRTASATSPSLLSGFPRKRLEGEMVRDALLEVSGQLDRTQGGTLVDWKNNEYTPRDQAPFQSKRRSIYLPVVRDRVYDMFSIFDCANPSVGASRRDATVVSHQALYFLNSPDVVEAAIRLARRATDEAATESGRLAQAHRIALGRDPAPREMRRAREFMVALREVPSKIYASAADPVFAAFCHALLASNEFLYLD